jgi:hypothetical protein
MLPKEIHVLHSPRRLSCLPPRGGRYRRIDVGDVRWPSSLLDQVPLVVAVIQSNESLLEGANGTGSHAFATVEGGNNVDPGLTVTETSRGSNLGAALIFVGDGTVGLLDNLVLEGDRRGDAGGGTLGAMVLSEAALAGNRSSGPLLAAKVELTILLGELFHFGALGVNGLDVEHLEAEIVSLLVETVVLGNEVASHFLASPLDHDATRLDVQPLATRGVIRVLVAALGAGGLDLDHGDGFRDR